MRHRATDGASKENRGGGSGTGSPPPRVSPEVLDRLVGRIAVATGRPVAPVLAPFTGQPIRDVPLGAEADVVEAAQQARAAQAAWAQKSVRERCEVFLRYHDLVLARQAEILDLIQLESGKARGNAFEEVADTAIVSRYYAMHGEDHLRPRRRRGALPGLTSTWEYHHPLGVIGFIAPWNYPLSLSVTDAIAALVAGNGVVLKPDQQAPFTALFAVELMVEAGLPPGLFRIVTGRGRELGGPLIANTDYLCFTGSTQTGRAVARQAGERLIGCSLELGGKNPMLVLADADVERAADGAVRGCFSSAGQLCISIERIYAHASVFDRFLERFVARTNALRLGGSFDFDADIGSLVSEEHLAKVEEHVEDAVATGATLQTGGKPRPDLGPLFYEPTILTDVTPKARLFAEETFGPVVALYPFEELDEAIEKANGTSYGLNASVWSNDTRLGRAVAARIQAGTVNVNEAYAATWASVDAPMGGFKDSGLGRRHGAAGILKYTEAQTIAVQRFLPMAAPRGVSAKQFSEAMSRALWVMKRIPGIR